MYDLIVRPSKDEVFLEEARLHARRSTCLRRAVGAVAVLDGRVLATGYNGVPPGHPHCRICARAINNVPSGQRAECCKGLHAEQNLIIQAAIFGINLVGATIYCTTSPCNICMKMLVSIKPKRIVYLENYDDPLAEEVAETDGLVYRFNEEGQFHERIRM